MTLDSKHFGAAHKFQASDFWASYVEEAIVSYFKHYCLGFYATGSQANPNW